MLLYYHSDIVEQKGIKQTAHDQKQLDMTEGSLLARYKKEKYSDAIFYIPFFLVAIQLGGVRVAHLFIFLCCPIMCLYLLSSVWFVFVYVQWCPAHIVLCFCLRIVVSSTYCVVFLFTYSGDQHILCCVFVYAQW